MPTITSLLPQVEQIMKWVWLICKVSSDGSLIKDIRKVFNNKNIYTSNSLSFCSDSGYKQLTLSLVLYYTPKTSTSLYVHKSGRNFGVMKKYLRFHKTKWRSPLMRSGTHYYQGVNMKCDGNGRALSFISLSNIGQYPPTWNNSSFSSMS